MKTLHFASILVLAAATTFACNDDGDRLEGASAGSAGKTSAAGSAGKAGAAGMSNHAGAGGASASAGAGGDAGATSEAGAGGGARANEGGAAGGGAGGGGAGGESGEGGAAGSGVMGGAAGEGGTGGEGGAPVQAPLEIIGSWDNNFGGEDVITATEWSSFGFGSPIVKYDNDANVVYTQSGGTFSKTVYVDIENDAFYYCTIDFGKATLADAIASTKVADASSPGTGGCSTFTWTKLTRQ